MEHFPPSNLRYICFSQVYEHNIELKIREIDLFLKTTSPPYEAKDVSDLLHISLDDLNYIIEEENLNTLDTLSFFKIIHISNSYICQLIQREWEYYGVAYYTPEAISYIYELNLDKVRHAFEKSGLNYVEPHNLKELFSYIYVPIINLN